MSMSGVATAPATVPMSTYDILPLGMSASAELLNGESVSSANVICLNPEGVKVTLPDSPTVSSPTVIQTLRGVNAPGGGQLSAGSYTIVWQCTLSSGVVLASATGLYVQP